MSTLAGAVQSPEIVNGVFRWHEGDIFMIVLQIELYDQDDTPIEIPEGASFILECRNPRREVVKTFELEAGENGIANLVFDEETTALFPFDIYKCKMIYMPPEDEDDPYGRCTIGIYDFIVEG